jgi:hypothetical protein
MLIAGRAYVRPVFVRDMDRRTLLRRVWRVACCAWLFACQMFLHAQGRIQLQVDTSEADAVLSILAHRAAGQPAVDADWERLFGSEPYRRLKQREAGRKRTFDDVEFQQFVLSDQLLKGAAELQRTLTGWKRTDLDVAARRVLGYLPPHAQIRAKVFPVIKPQTNSFVFELLTDPSVFLYVDPTLDAAQFENTVAHELHHIGLASVVAEATAALEELPPRERIAAERMGSFGEGIAMLAAAGGPDTHPHAHSSVETRARWDADMTNFGRDLQSLERFFLDIIDGRLADEAQIVQEASEFFGVQGPWYTVGWKMAALIEQRYGREALIECMLDPRRLLATYNRAVGDARQRGRLPRWSDRLIEAVRARPVSAAAGARE